jgi:predicted ATPase
LPSTILLDEPELGLHPAAIHLLASLLRSISQQTQIIVSTQSVTLVNQFEADDLIVMEKNDGESIFRRLDSTELEHWLDEYDLGTLWEKNLLGGRP